MDEKDWTYWPNVKQKNPPKIQEKQGNDASKSRSSARRRAICAHAKTTLKESLITSWPQIVSSKNWIQRLIKILVFLLCVLGFIYQTANFLSLYLSYPTSVNVHISNPSKILPPAITVCNRNRRKRSVFCERNPLLCSNSPLLCETNPRFCPIKNREKSYKKMVLGYDMFASQGFNWTVAWDETHRNNIKVCTIMTDTGTLNCDYPPNIPYLDFKGEPTYCQVIQSLFEQPDQEVEYFPNTYTYEIELNTQPEEYIWSSESVGMQIAVHDRRALVNPFVDGTVLEGGKAYICHVSMTQTIQLEDPYDTHCVDYVAMWKKNNGEGPLNKRSCIEECKLKMALQTPQGCVDRYVSYPHEEPLCDKGTITTTAETVQLCTESCPNACIDHFYQVECEKNKDLTELCTPADEHCRVKDITITLSFRKFQLTKFTYEPRFESIELYSYVGGYMGMWLGLSLVSLFDLLETLFKLILYPVRRSISKKKRKKVKPSHRYQSPKRMGYY